MRIKLRLFQNIALILSLTFCTLLFAQDITENKALDYLFNKIENSKVYETRIKMSCLSTITEDKTAQYFDVGLHEKHDEVCGGDPTTSPVVDRFRVYRNNHKVLWYDVVNDEYLPFVKFVKLQKSN
jgi:hypothetical protein